MHIPIPRARRRAYRNGMADGPSAVRYSASFRVVRAVSERPMDARGTARVTRQERVGETSTRSFSPPPPSFILLELTIRCFALIEIISGAFFSF